MMHPAPRSPDYSISPALKNQPSYINISQDKALEKRRCCATGKSCYFLFKTRDQKQGDRKEATMVKVDLTAQGIVLGRSVAGPIPAGARIVGFSRRDPGDYGALVRLKNGDMVQCYHGVCRPLPPLRMEKARGGAKRGNGTKKSGKNL
jgi:hypothetical protein